MWSSGCGSGPSTHVSGPQSSRRSPGGATMRRRISSSYSARRSCVTRPVGRPSGRDGGVEAALVVAGDGGHGDLRVVREEDGAPAREEVGEEPRLLVDEQLGEAVV